MTASADWHDFATTIGGASGALTGLLFVSVSLNAKRIAGHTGLRASAVQTLVLFLTPLIIATALLTPRQPDWVLGAELAAIGLVAGMVLLVVHRAKLALADQDLRGSGPSVAVAWCVRRRPSARWPRNLLGAWIRQRGSSPGPPHSGSSPPFVLLGTRRALPSHHRRLYLATGSPRTRWL